MSKRVDSSCGDPPLTNGPLTGRYLVSAGHMPRGHESVSSADVAHFLPDEVESVANGHVWTFAAEGHITAVSFAVRQAFGMPGADECT